MVVKYIGYAVNANFYAVKTRFEVMWGRVFDNASLGDWGQLGLQSKAQLNQDAANTLSKTTKKNAVVQVLAIGLEQPRICCDARHHCATNQLGAVLQIDLKKLRHLCLAPRAHIPCQRS